MDKYLLDILKEMNTIIIPGLGALTITNNTTGEIMFMPYLKYDDGKLARYIAQKEDWSENEAHNLIAKYVREIEAKLNIGDTYDMYRFGTFCKNSSGDIEFNRWKDANINDDETNIVEPIIGEKVIEDSKDETITEPLIQTEIEENTNAEHTDFEHIEAIKQSSEPEKEIFVPEEIQVTEYVPDPIVPETKFQLYSEEDQWNDDLDIPPVNSTVKRAKKPILEKAHKDEKQRKPILIITLVAGFLLIGTTLTMVIYNNSFRDIKTEQNKKTVNIKLSERRIRRSVEPKKVTNNKSKDVILEFDAVTKENVSTNESDISVSAMIQTSTGQIDPAKPYHLIAGAFSVKENAVRFKNKLRETGNLNSEIIGRFDGLYFVSANSYRNSEEAHFAKKENTATMKLWVFRWP